MKYDIMKYDVMKYDVKKYDIMFHDVMKYDHAIITYSKKIKQIREDWDTLTFYFAQLCITQIFGLG